MAAFEVAETPVALGRQLIGTTDAAQTFSPLHAVKKDFEHGAGGFANRDDLDALVAG